MKDQKIISGFSKLSKRGKIKWLAKNFFTDPEGVKNELVSYWHNNEDQQKILDGFSENTISNYPMPYGVAPNFVINNKPYCVPMVIEESSVVAAASSAAKYWMSRGGFKTEILNTKKVGQVHFKWQGDKDKLYASFSTIQSILISDTKSLTKNMEARGGGIEKIELIDFTNKEDNYYQLKVSFETCDSMGANFINSVLEQFALTLKNFCLKEKSFEGPEKEVNIIMSILSNYTPECVVRAKVSCDMNDLGKFPNGMTSEEFAYKFETAINIAHIDPYRATTHNKGIFNGIDSVVIATGNDFRAIEACGHTYAAKDGQYRSLSHCEVKDGVFNFWLDIPLAIGTVGGLTSLHPIAKRSLELLGSPNAEELMGIIAATGLAQNFAAVRSLITVGIQQGHMKMHLLNILNHLQATELEIKSAVDFFGNKVISFSSVRDFIKKKRSKASKMATDQGNY